MSVLQKTIISFLPYQNDFASKIIYLHFFSNLFDKFCFVPAFIQENVMGAHDPSFKNHRKIIISQSLPENIPFLNWMFENSFLFKYSTVIGVCEINQPVKSLQLNFKIQ